MKGGPRRLGPLRAAASQRRVTMQTRHRVPNVFTLYMVDVLCCALGCVILLWFLKINEARQHVREALRQEEAARETGSLLASVQKERDDLVERLAGSHTQLESAE